MRVWILAMVALGSGLTLAGASAAAVVGTAQDALESFGASLSSDPPALSAEPVPASAVHGERLPEVTLGAEDAPAFVSTSSTSAADSVAPVRIDDPPLCESVYARIVSVSPQNPKASAATLALGKNSRGVFRYVGQAVGRYRIEAIGYDALKARPDVELSSKKEGLCRARFDSGRRASLPSVKPKKKSKKTKKKSSKVRTLGAH